MNPSDKTPEQAVQPQLAPTPLTDDQKQSIEALKHSIVTIQKVSQEESINGAMDSRTASQVLEAANIMAKDIERAILDIETQITDDKIYLIRDSINLMTSAFLINSSYDTVIQMASQFNDIATNYVAAVKAGRMISDANNALRTAILARKGFEGLIRRSESIIREFGKMENMVKIAPRTADHMLRVIRQDQKK